MITDKKDRPAVSVRSEVRQVLARYPLGGERNHDFLELEGWDALQLRIRGRCVSGGDVIMLRPGTGAAVTSGYHVRWTQTQSASSMPTGAASGDMSSLLSGVDAGSSFSLTADVDLSAGELSVVCGYRQDGYRQSRTVSADQMQSALNSLHLDVGNAAAWSGELILVGVRYD